MIASKQKRLTYLLFSLLLIWQSGSSAANSRFAVWIPVTVVGKVKSYLYEFQPQLRINEDNAAVDQVLVNYGMGLPTGNLMPWFGVTYSYNALDAQSDVEEVRLWEQLMWVIPGERYRWQSRTRLEQRKATHFGEVANRIRERVALQRALNKSMDWLIGNEFFVNLNRVDWVSTKTIDQNRFYTGLEHPFVWNWPWRVSLGYMNQTVFTTPRQSDHILLFAVTLDLT